MYVYTCLHVIEPYTGTVKCASNRPCGGRCQTMLLGGVNGTCVWGAHISWGFLGGVNGTCVQVPHISGGFWGA